MDKYEKELTRQLPEYFRPILEFKEILKAQGYVIGQLDSDMAVVKANNYISSCDEETIAYFEQLFGVVYRYGDTLDFRRSRVLQKFNTIVPFSMEFLRSKLTELFGSDYELSVNPKTCTLTVKVTSSRYGAIDLLYDLLWDVVPAHLQIIANQETTSHSRERIYAAGFASSISVQTIYKETTYGIDGNINSAGFTANTAVQNIGG